MSRIVNTENVGTKRSRLVRAIVLAIRELAKQSKPDSKTKDLAAFLALALVAVAETIEETVAPWEKRGYWLKADRFRMDWGWVENAARALREAVLKEDWGEVAAQSARVAAKLGSVEISERHRLGTPWVGAWDKLRAENASTVLSKGK